MSSVEVRGEQSDRPAAGNGLDDEVDVRRDDAVTKIAARGVVAEPGVTMAGQHARQWRSRVRLAVGIVVGYLHGCDLMPGPDEPGGDDDDDGRGWEGRSPTRRVCKTQAA
jgi:hypothetical protein